MLAKEPNGFPIPAMHTLSVHCYLLIILITCPDKRLLVTSRPVGVQRFFLLLAVVLNITAGLGAEATELDVGFMCN